MTYIYPFSTQFDLPSESANGNKQDDDSKKICELKYSEEDIDQIKKYSYELGYENGKVEGVLETEKLLQEKFNQSEYLTLESIRKNIDQNLQYDCEVEKKASSMALNIVQAITRKVLPVYLEKNGFDEIENIVKNIISGLFEKQKIVINVSPNNYEPIKKHFSGFNFQYNQEITIKPDIKIDGFNCFIQWENGGAIVSHNDVFNRFLEIIDSHLVLNSQVLIKDQIVNRSADDGFNDDKKLNEHSVDHYDFNGGVLSDESEINYESNVEGESHG